MSIPARLPLQPDAIYRADGVKIPLHYNFTKLRKGACQTPHAITDSRDNSPTGGLRGNNGLPRIFGEDISKKQRRGQVVV
jgi:hypothetical protein